MVVVGLLGFEIRGDQLALIWLELASHEVSFALGPVVAAKAMM